MSTMLEQAIIDDNALRVAELQTAENAVVEKYFAGIGARSTPKWALDMCQRICVDVMNEEGYILRS